MPAAMQATLPTQCLAKAMRTAGHTLDWGCGLCPFQCSYATPCGCGAAGCIDRARR
ncbi:MAG: hypothetical protein QOD77_1266 [Thermoplasmata archaeon]|jgi:hypothetical protein|nr:hypothetical protein [Thermoplasmata archaeon]